MDVTERRHERDRPQAAAACERSLLLALLDSSPDYLAFKDTEGRYLCISRSLARRFGLRSPDEAIGRTAGDFLPAAAAAKASADDRRVLETGEALTNLLELERTPSGHSVWHSVHRLPLRDERGRVVGTVAVGRDVTGEKLADERLAYHAHLLDNVSDGIVATDAEGRITAWNRAAEAIWGWTAAEALGEDARALLAADWPARFADEARAVLERGETLYTELPSRRKDGAEVIVAGATRALRDEAGGLTSTVTVARNVTERTKAEAEREAARALVDAVIESLPGFIWVKDAERFCYVKVSRRWQEYIGIDPSDALGRDDFDLFPAELASAIRAEDEAAIARGRLDLEKRGLTPERADRVLRVTKQRIDGADGAPLYLLVYAEDVTDERRTQAEVKAIEEKFNRMAERIDEVFWMVSADSKQIEYLNPAFERIWGLPRARVLADAEAYFRSVHPDDRELVRAAWARIDEEPFNLEYRIVRPDGEVRWVRDRAFDIRDEHGDRQHFFGIVTDVTERRQARAERERLEAEMRVAQRLEAVGQLAAGIAHEINTPIQFIGDSVRFLDDCCRDLLELIEAYRAVCEAAQASAVAAAQVDRAARVEDEIDLAYLIERIPAAFERTFEGIERVSTIVKAMKAFAHPDRAEQRAEDLNEALRNTLIVARNEYKYVADVEAEYGDIPPVTCHLGDVNQVFLNLIVNAAHAIQDAGYTHERKGRIRIRTEREGNDVVITIADTGCGIPPEHQARLFEPFFTTKEVGRGTGQGLALARAIVVEKHGGQLSFESEVGVGTTFRIALPIAGRRAETDGRAA